MVLVPDPGYLTYASVARLIGAPPGYVGYEEGGVLTEAIHRRPYAVILFDEIEKAHRDVFNILLQVMEDGILTDSQGRRVDFRNAVLIMTSNAGAADMARPPIGFNRAKREGEDMEAVAKLFTPEFRNRLDATIQFKPLERGVDHRPRRELGVQGIGRHDLDLVPSEGRAQAFRMAADDPHLARGDVRFEPAGALVSGTDGLDDIRHIVARAPRFLRPGGWLWLEHGYEQAEQVATPPPYLSAPTTH